MKEGRSSEADSDPEEFNDRIPFYDPFLPESPRPQRSISPCPCCRSSTNRSARRSHALNNVPDSPDSRDILADFTKAVQARLPTQVDLRAEQPRPPPDTSEACSSVAGAIAAAFHFDQRKRHWERWADFVPSVRFIHYNQRLASREGDHQGLSSLRSAIKSVKLWGVCPESQWPYDGKRLDERPPPECYRVGKTFRATAYKAVNQSLPQLKACLALGQPFVFGFVVHGSFNTGPVECAGDMSMPDGDTDPVEGGHTACAVGYSDAQQVFVVYNSWGPEWGDSGNFYMPYDYITDPKLAYDFWTISWAGNDGPLIRKDARESSEETHWDVACPVM